MKPPDSLSGGLSWNIHSLGIKLFGSYLLIIAIGTLVILTAIDLVAPNSFNLHMQMMQDGTMSGGGMMGQGVMGQVQNNLNITIDQAFKSSLNEAMLIAGGVGVGVAIFISYFVTRLIVTPVRRLARASQRIAAGQYAERIPQAGAGKDELGEMALSFNEMAQALETTERRRLELIGDVAHELRTPVATLEGYMEGLLDGVVKPSEELWISLHEEAGRLRRLIDDLQELSRAEARQISLRLTPVNPLDIAGAAVERLATQFKEKGLEFTTELPSRLPAVRADRDRAVQVLTNLLTNAFRYTPAPGKVTLELAAKEDCVEFRVTDTGFGISPEDLPHLFERFYRVDKSRSRALGGSGVGLTIAKALVEEMGGRIGVASGGPGQGSTFSFTLPLAASML